MIKEKKKPSYSDYFAHKQPTFGFEYHDEQKNKEDISKIKDIIIHELQNRTPKKLLLTDGTKDIDGINKMIEEGNKEALYETLEKNPNFKKLLNEEISNLEEKIQGEP